MGGAVFIWGLSHSAWGEAAERQSGRNGPFGSPAATGLKLLGAGAGHLHCRVCTGALRRASFPPTCGQLMTAAEW